MIARIFMVYGPGVRDQSKLVPYVIQSLLRGESPRLGSGARPVDWIYVQDVVEGLIHLAERDASMGETVDIGSGKTVTVRAVVERIAAIMRSKIPLHFDAAADRPLEQIRVTDAERTAALIGWRASTSSDQGLAAVVESMR